MLINIKISAETSAPSLLSETVAEALQLVKATKYHLSLMTRELCMELVFNDIKIPITSSTSVDEAADYYYDRLENLRKRRKKKIAKQY